MLLIVVMIRLVTDALTVTSLDPIKAYWAVKKSSPLKYNIYYLIG